MTITYIDESNKKITLDNVDYITFISNKLMAVVSYNYNRLMKDIPISYIITITN